MSLPCRRLLVLLAVAWVAASAGCVRVGPHKRHPVRHMYVLEAERPAARQTSGAYSIEVEPPNESALGASALPSLEVRRFSVSPLYRSREFVYRTSGGESVSDYYHLFTIDPASLLTDNTRRWMSGAGLFSRIVDPDSLLDAKRTLEGRATDLYGDFTDRKNPRAVLSIHFLLIDDTGAEPQVLFERTYSESAPIAKADGPALIEGWNQALETILTNLESDLRDRGV